MIKRTLIFLDRLHWLWLALAAPFLLFPSPKRSMAMLVIPALFLLRWLATKGKQQTEPRENQALTTHRPSLIPSSPLNGALLLLVLMVLVSLWATFDINFSLPKISGIVLGLGIFFAFGREGKTPRGWWLGILLFIGIGFGIASLGLLGTNWITKIAFLTPVVSRLSPLIIGLPGAAEGFHPNTVAGALLWAIPSLLAFSWLLLTRAKVMQSLYGRLKTDAVTILMVGVTLWSMAILILTQSRDGYLSLALTLPVLILIALPSHWRKYSLAILLLLAIVLGVLINSHWETVRTWVTGSDMAGDPALSLNTLIVRQEVWSRAIYGIQDFPFTGMGMNVFRKVMPVLYPLFNFPPEMDIGHAHDEFLQAALDLGIPGLIAFSGLYVIAFWMLIRIWKSARVDTQTIPSRKGKEDSLTKSGGWFSVIGISPYSDASLIQMVVLGLGGGLLAHLLWGLTDAMALGARPAFLFWVILGLISGLHQQGQERLVRIESDVSVKETKIGMSK